MGVKRDPREQVPFLTQVEANNTVTKDRATTIVEIQVSEREPPSTGEHPQIPRQGGFSSGTGISGDRGKPEFCTCHHQSPPHPQKLEEQLGLQVTPLWKPPRPLGPLKDLPQPALGEVLAHSHLQAQP